MMTYGRACRLLSPTMQFEWQCFCKYGLVNIIYGLLYHLVVNIFSVLYPLVVNILSVTSWMSRILATPNYGLSLSANRRFMHSIQGDLWRLYTANNLFVIYKNIFMVVDHNIVSSSSPSSSSRLKWWYTVLPGAAATGNVYRTWAIMCDLYSILDGTPRPSS